MIRIAHITLSINEGVIWLETAPPRLVPSAENFPVCYRFFQNFIVDTSAFIYIYGGDVVYILVYVDDIIVTGSSNYLTSGFIDMLANRFSLKDPKDLSYFLGIEATRTFAGLHLMQRKYIIDFLVKTYMLDAKQVAMPMALTPKLTLYFGTPLDDLKLIHHLHYMHFLMWTGRVTTMTSSPQTPTSSILAHL